MPAQIFALIGLRLLGVYFVVCGSPIIPAFLLSFFGVPGFTPERQDIAPHLTRFIALPLQPPPITALVYLLCGVVLIVASRFLTRLLCYDVPVA